VLEAGGVVTVDQTVHIVILAVRAVALRQGVGGIGRERCSVSALTFATDVHAHGVAVVTVLVHQAHGLIDYGIG